MSLRLLIARVRLWKNGLKDNKRRILIEKNLPFCRVKSISLRSWSIGHNNGDASRVNWLFDKVIGYIDENADISSMKIFTVDRAGVDILLDDMQIIQLEPVLVEFFGKEEFDEVAKYIKLINVDAHSYHGALRTLEEMTKTELTKFYQDWIDTTSDAISDRLPDEASKQAYDTIRDNYLKMIKFVLKRKWYSRANNR